eukprot:gene11311-21501_t
MALYRVIFLVLALHYSAIECTVVSIKGLGSVQGTTRNLSGSLVDTFWGVPFGKPPLGNLRFAPPEKVEPWTKVINGTKVTCLQYDVTTRKVKGGEDCLYLNIFRKRTATARKMDVMVFIHGGSYTGGAGHQYNGEALAALHDVVVVTINYRLGILGFYSIPDTELTGNYGLQDQILALKWVKEHISDFGGDPSKVTIFGESAGAGCVSLLLLSPMTKGLFTRAIAESGSALNIWAVYEKQNNTMAYNFAQRSGCNRTSTAKCLRSKSALYLLFKQITSKSYPLISPTVDGKVITVFPFQESIMGKLPVPDVELMIGFNKDEGTMFIPSIEWTKLSYHQTVKETLQLRYKEDTAMATEVASFEYNRFTKPENLSLQLSCKEFIGDIYFREGIIRLAGDWAKAGKRVFLYYFTFLPENLKNPSLGVSHAIELGFVFGRPVLGASDWFVSNYTKTDKNKSLKLMKMWTDFAKNGVADSKWPLYNLTDKKYLEININDTVQQDFSPKRMTFWHNTLPNVLALAKANTKQPTATPQICTTQKTASSAPGKVGFTYTLVTMLLLAFFGL